MSNDITFQIKFINAIFKKEKIIKVIIIVVDVILLFSLISSRGYKNSFGEIYFVGFTAHQHTMASAACFQMSLILLEFDLHKNEKINLIKYFIFFIPPIISVLQTSARIFLIPALILICYFYFYEIRKLSLKIFLLPFGSLTTIYLFFNSNVFARMINMSGSTVSALSSGRVDFWQADLNSFIESPLLNKIFGNGFEFVKQINEKFTSVAIGAHNDYITVLLGIGLLGLGIHIIIFWKEIMVEFSLDSKIKSILLLLFWLLPSMFNGFYGYQLLLYSYLLLKLIVFDGNKVKHKKVEF